MKTRMALCAVALFATSACGEQRSIPFELAGMAAGAALGGFAGAQFGGGFGQWAYMAGGAIIGGIGGFEAGRILRESDLVLYNGAAEKAFADKSNGKTMNWSNPETGLSGAFRPTQTFQAQNGQTCRHFRSTVAFADAVESGDGTACYEADGRWRIVSNYFG